MPAFFIAHITSLSVVLSGDGSGCTIKPIPVPSGFSKFSPSRLNGHGVIVGGAWRDRLSHPNYEQATVFNGRSARLLPSLYPLLSPRGTATAINDLGWIVGAVQSKLGPWRAVLWKHKKIVPMQPDPLSVNDPGSIVTDINNRGQMVGQASNRHAFVLFHGKSTDLGTLGGASSFASRLNRHGSVVGYSSLAGSVDKPVSQGFVWRNGLMRSLRSLGGKESVARSINDGGVIVGQADTKAGTAHAVRWTNLEPKDLGTLGGKISEALDIDSYGRIVGWSQLKDGSSRAFVWQGTVMTDLNRLLPKNSGWVLTSARTMNSQGCIAGVGTLLGKETGFVLILATGQQRRAVKRVDRH